LILEGGAMRGVWAAGLLAFLHERGQHQYDLVYAASSGGLFSGLLRGRDVGAGPSHLARPRLQRGAQNQFSAPQTHHRPGLSGRSRVPVALPAFRRELQKAPTRFHITLTDCLTGEPNFFHVQDDRVFAALRATASMPFATSGFDFVDGHPYADGGLVDPIPLRRALQDGATEITVLRTHSPSFRLKPILR
jgi:predicted patatin/cPLA2 family phospholipase